MPTSRKALVHYNLTIHYCENVFLPLPKARVMIDRKNALNKNVCFKLTKCIFQKLWLYLGHKDIGVGTNMVSPLEMLLEILVFSVIILRLKLKEYKSYLKVEVEELVLDLKVEYEYDEMDFFA